MTDGNRDDLFASWLLARENGEERDIESLAAEHPTCAEALRAQHAELLRLESVLGLSSRPTEQAPNSDADAPPDPGLLLIPPLRGETEAKRPSLLDRLTQRGPPRGRFVVEDQVGEGGMGAVFRVYDSEIGRHVAAKVLHLDDPERHLPRFLEEAQITGQLDHPAFIPVHDFAVDEKGRVFFTMKLVKGITDENTDENTEEIRAGKLSYVIKRIHAGADDWTLTRGLDVIRRVAEAMEFAHVKGVIHRDLKPENILVGRYGEVYVIDFGIARVRATRHLDAGEARSEGSDAESSDPSTTSPNPLTLVRTGRRDTIEHCGADPPTTASPDSPGPTREGSVMGTPPYMPPEQARGSLGEIDGHSDIYSLGATLYHLIAGVPPWHTRDHHPLPFEIVRSLERGERPAPLQHLSPDSPPELLAIVDKAMAADPKKRYGSMDAFAADLRAYLEQRVVSAYKTGALAELKKWVQRNPALAAAAGLLIVVLAISTAVVLNKNVEISAQKTAVEARKAEFDQLAGKVHLERAIAREKDLYPPWPEKIEAMERWLAEDAQRLLDLKPKLESTLADLRERSLPTPVLEASMSTPESVESAQPIFAFALDSETFLYTSLFELSVAIAGFESVTRSMVERRLAWARRIGELTIHHPNARSTWDEARSAILKADDVVASRLYAQATGRPIDLKPQTGLIPIGMNPVTKLWEFYELRSACDVLVGQDPATLEIPTHREDGSIEIKDGMGIVFVLVPGGAFLQGAQCSDENAPNFDADAQADESRNGAPVQLTIDPFFLAKYETTQGQWYRLTGENPSYWMSQYPSAAGLDHPIEYVTWRECASMCSQSGLSLPTEAQWEYACRAGTSSPFSFGDSRASMAMHGNVRDVSYATVLSDSDKNSCDEFDDGARVACRVGRYKGNDFGIFDMHGNVSEWCRDAYCTYESLARGGDGFRESDDAGLRIQRGGSFSGRAASARSAFRRRTSSDTRRNNLGVRLARILIASSD